MIKNYQNDINRTLIGFWLNIKNDKITLSMIQSMIEIFKKIDKTTINELGFLFSKDFKESDLEKLLNKDINYINIKEGFIKKHTKRIKKETMTERKKLFKLNEQVLYKDTYTNVVDPNGPFNTVGIMVENSIKFVSEHEIKNQLELQYDDLDKLKILSGIQLKPKEIKQKSMYELLESYNKINLNDVHLDEIENTPPIDTIKSDELFKEPENEFTNVDDNIEKQINDYVPDEINNTNTVMDLPASSHEPLSFKEIITLLNHINSNIHNFNINEHKEMLSKMDMIKMSIKNIGMSYLNEGVKKK